MDILTFDVHLLQQHQLFMFFGIIFRFGKIELSSVGIIIINSKTTHYIFLLNYIHVQIIII